VKAGAQSRVSTRTSTSRKNAFPGSSARPDAHRAPWALGQIGPGEEWLAATFRDQPTTPLTVGQLRDLLRGADDIWIHAYEAMTLGEEHRWHVHESKEVGFVLDTIGGGPARALDVGCGDGRHARALTDHGWDTVGVDIAASLVEAGREHPSAAELLVGDARKELPAGPFDLVLCLYDVLGSSARPEDDVAILANIQEVLRPGGWLALSVMNETVVRPQLPEGHVPRDQGAFLAALETLRPSTTMESSGAIFDATAMLLYDGVYYRKEQFTRPGSRLPAELVVRDRRFSAESISTLVSEAGFEVHSCTPVQAGQWSRTPSLAPTDTRAKEWLVFARRPDGPAADNPAPDVLASARR
jgi:SAM-dependent methyltransferase